MAELAVLVGCLLIKGPLPGRWGGKGGPLDLVGPPPEAPAAKSPCLIGVCPRPHRQTRKITRICSTGATCRLCCAGSVSGDAPYNPRPGTTPLPPGAQWGSSGQPPQAPLRLQRRTMFMGKGGGGWGGRTACSDPPLTPTNRSPHSGAGHRRQILRAPLVFRLWPPATPTTRGPDFGRPSGLFRSGGLPGHVRATAIFLCTHVSVRRATSLCLCFC
ncbi:hypothetical protein NDU88_003868 [Pleurodeles waltl]|uniref:Uncharacterized protein n=1 Tax=Pleurodeles waltl TaxID=8319 RepID=A0AAV7LJT1_PLEWA|nr:hypothetical protein NDU88_003868 [Pleurodeles waltl]